VSPVNRDRLFEAFNALREMVTNAGVPPMPIPLALGDRIQARVRADLEEAGVDPSDREAMAAAICGWAVAMKVMIQSGIQEPLYYARWVVLFDAIWPMLSVESPDLAELGIEDFDVDWSTYCPLCLHPKETADRLCPTCTQRELQRQQVQPGPMPPHLVAWAQRVLSGQAQVPSFGPHLGHGPMRSAPPPSPQEAPVDESETVPFTPEAVMAYLDGAIRSWRKKRDRAIGGDIRAYNMAVFYVDAYQSVRESLFGELLPVDASPTSSDDDARPLHE
jgi:hypothetical protein